jgi:hypothetical protein
LNFREFSVKRLSGVVEGESKFTAIDRRCGGSIVVGTESGRVIRFGCRGGARVFLPTQAEGEVIGIESSCDFAKTMVCHAGGTVEILEEESVVETFNAGGDLLSAFWHISGQFVGAGLQSGWAVFAIPGGREVAGSRTGGGFGIAAYHPDGVLLGLAQERGTEVHIVDLSGHAGVVEWKVSDGVVALDFSENGRFMAVGSENYVRVVDLKDMSMVREFRATCLDLAFDETGFLLGVVGRNEWTLRECGEKDGEMKLEIAGCQKGRFGGDGTFFACIGDLDNLDLIGGSPP